MQPDGEQTQFGSGLSHPSGVAVDSAGSVFVADTVNDRVLEYPPYRADSTSLSASSASVMVGQRTSLTASVHPAPGGGTVSFQIDGTLLSGCQAEDVSDGYASCSTRFRLVGTETLTGSYSGDSEYAGSDSPNVVVRVHSPVSVVGSPKARSGKVTVAKTITLKAGKSRTVTLSLTRAQERRTARRSP